MDSSNSKEKDMKIVIVKSSDLNDVQRETIVKTLTGAGYTVDVIAPEDVDKYNAACIVPIAVAENMVSSKRAMERRIMGGLREGGIVLATVDTQERNFSSIVNAVSAMTVGKEYAVSDLYSKEPQHLVQKNKSDLPFYHSRRRW